MTVWKTPYGWRYQFMHQRQKYSKSGFKTKREAEAAEAVHKKAVKKLTSSPPEPKPLGLSSLAVEYMEHCQRRLTDTSWRYTKGYKYKVFVIQSFLDFAGDTLLSQLTVKLIEDYLKTRPTNTNYNRHRKDLCAMFTWGWRRGFLTEHPCFYIDRLPEQKQVRVVPTPEEMAKILLAAGEDRPFILVMYYTLARLDEVLRLRWEDVNFEQKWLRLWTRKRQGGGWEFDLLPLDDERGKLLPLYDLLLNLYHKRESNEWVFPNPKTGGRYMARPKLMAGICKRAGVRQIGFHGIRHFVASLLADREKVSVARLKPLLRHKSLRTTEIYLNRIDNSMREVMGKIPEVENLTNVLKLFPQKIETR